MNATFRVAACSLEITPDLNRHEIRLHGYGARGNKTAEGVHDPLHGKVLLLEYGQVKAAIVTMDILQIDALFRQDLIAKAGIDGLTEENILIAASHTHSAPAALQKRSAVMSGRLKWYLEDYYETVIQTLAEGLRQAEAALKPAVYAIDQVGVSPLMRNRRVPSYDYTTRGFSAPPLPGEILDDQLTALCFKDESENTIIATLVNLAGHGTVLGSDNMLISADWAGVMQRRVEEQLGGICLFANSAEGDVAPDCGNGELGFADVDAFGENIASRVVALMANGDVALPTRQVEVLAMATAKVKLPAHYIPEDSPYKRAGLAPELVQQFLEAIYPPETPQSVLRLNDIGIATIPGEMLTALSLDFKSRAGLAGIAYPMIFGLGNDSIGYIMTPEEYRKGGYEQEMCIYGPDLGNHLVDEALSALTLLFPHADL